VNILRAAIPIPIPMGLKHTAVSSSHFVAMEVAADASAGAAVERLRGTIAHLVVNVLTFFVSVVLYALGLYAGATSNPHLSTHAAYLTAQTIVSLLFSAQVLRNRAYVESTAESVSYTHLTLPTM
jgi:hypothetical protein